MTVPFWRQVRAILWKNWLLKRKSPVATFFEVRGVCACDGGWREGRAGIDEIWSSSRLDSRSFESDNNL